MPITQYRTAIVTGASSGIGAAAVRRLTAAGLVVHALARDAGRLARMAEETGCIAHPMDIRDGAALEGLVPGLDADILVNAAGVNRPERLEQTAAGDVSAVLDTNLAALIDVTRLCMPGMRRRDRGHIVNLGSISGLHGFAGNAVYHAAKAGVHAFSQQLRHDLFGTRVRVTVIAPGRVATEMFERTFGEQAGRAFIEAHDSLQADDIVDAVIFALSAPWRMNVSLMEIWPTYQTIAGLRFAQPGREPTNAS